jgi:hypothetical protein
VENDVYVIAVAELYRQDPGQEKKRWSTETKIENSGLKNE